MSTSLEPATYITRSGFHPCNRLPNAIGFPPALPARPDRRILARGRIRRGRLPGRCLGGGRVVPARWRGLALASEQRPLQVRQLGLQPSLPFLRSLQVGLRSLQVGLPSVECALELLTASARGPPPDWLSFLAGLRPAHNDRADRPIPRWQGCRGKVKCSADIFLLAHPALPDALHPLHRRRPVAPPATPELLCLSVAVADEIRFACLCATLVVLRQSLTVAPRNLNAYSSAGIPR